MFPRLTTRRHHIQMAGEDQASLSGAAQPGNHICAIRLKRLHLRLEPQIAQAARNSAAGPSLPGGFTEGNSIRSRVSCTTRSRSGPAEVSINPRHAVVSVAMQKLATLFILGSLLFAGRVSAAPAASAWGALDGDASQSNFNSIEKSITPGNALKMSVKWSVAIAEQSYPVVSGGRIYAPVVAGKKIHVEVLDALSGKKVGSIPKDASGGMAAGPDGNLYLAGKSLQEFDPSTGQTVATIHPPAGATKGVFRNPETDGTIIVVGYESNSVGKVYSINPTSGHVIRGYSSASAVGTISPGNVLTRTLNGSAMYDEASGRVVAQQRFAGSNWFAGPDLAYTVGTGTSKQSSVFAFDSTGQRQWSHVVGPLLATSGEWPHAVSSTGVYLQTLKPQPGIIALDPSTGKVLWTRPLPDVQSLLAVGNVVFVLTYGLGAPVRLVGYNATTGKSLGAKEFSTGFYGFGTQNQLMAADRMLYVRMIGPSGDELVALGH